MFLSRFGVKNYKCLAEIDIPLTPMHVLIGPNDAGKTSLLEAMAALHASSEKPLPEVFPKPWSGRDLVFHGASAPEVELWGEWSPKRQERPTPDGSFRYSLTIRFSPEGTNCSTQEEWMSVAGERRFLGGTFHTHQTNLAIWKRGPRLSEIPRIEDAQLVADVVKPAHKYAFDARIMAVPATLDPSRKFRLDSDGFGLPTLLLDILGFDAELFIRLRGEFCRFFPQFKSVRIESEQALQRHHGGSGFDSAGPGVGSGIYFETHSGRSVRAQQASDGAVLFLGFLALAHLPDPPNLLLIEEPENGIYPKRLGEVIAMLRELTESTQESRFPQIILSTHSPYVLSFFQPEEVTFLSRHPDKPEAGVRARPLRDAPNIRERMAEGEFYLGELWYNLSEEELFGEP